MSKYSSSHHDSYLTKFVKSPFFIASYTLIAVFCALLLQWSIEFVDPQNLLFGALLGFGIITAIVLTTVLLNKVKNQESLDSKVEDLSKLIINNNLNWMVNQEYLKMVELQSEETWTFATELTYAVQPDSEIFDGIRRNLAKGAKYIFFMPDRPRVHKIVADYKRLHKFETGQVEFILIPHSEFLFHTILSVYGVRTDRPRAIEWLPVRQLDVWVEMDEEHSNKMVGIGEILIRKYADRYTTQQKSKLDATPVVMNDK